MAQVDVEAAAAALKSGHLAGAAFDVFPHVRYPDCHLDLMTVSLSS